MPSEFVAVARRASLGKWSEERAQHFNVRPVNWRPGWNTGGEGAVAQRCCEADAKDEKEKYPMRNISRMRVTNGIRKYPDQMPSEAIDNVVPDITMSVDALLCGEPQPILVKAA